MELKKSKKILLLTLSIILITASVSGCFSKKPSTEEEEEVKETTLTIDEAKTVAIGDEYEKVIVQASGVTLEDGQADEIIIEPPVTASVK